MVAGDADIVDAAPTWIVTGSILSGAGAFNKCTEKLVLPTANAPQPAAATTLSATGVAEAVPPVNGVMVSQPGKGLTVLSTVNGVPPFAADVTLTVLADPGVYTEPALVHVMVTGFGEGASAEPELVTTKVATTLIGAMLGAVNVKVTVA